MSLEKYSYYKFEVYSEWTEHQTDVGEGGYAWVYKIHGEGCAPYDDGVIESHEWFESAQEARFAALGYIDLLENGEG